MAVITITPEQGWNALADAVVQAQPGDEIQLQEGEYLAKVRLYSRPVCVFTARGTLKSLISILGTLSLFLSLILNYRELPL